MSSNEKVIDLTPTNIVEEAQIANENSLPQKSRDKYLEEYQRFLQWKMDKNCSSFSENGSEYKLWGGCFEAGPSKILRRLNDSLPIDARLHQEDIQASREWARSLLDTGLLSGTDHESIQKGLQKVGDELKAALSNGPLNDQEEDIHSVVERRLGSHAGEAALRLHTGRSRNDQSATDTRLWMLTAINHLNDAVGKLIEVLIKRAEREIDIIIPGYTHLQRAQPVRWSHFLLSHTWALRDDIERLWEQRGRVARCPLGSGALAGCAFAIDRRALALRLGFDEPTPNSMYAVSNRDHVVEFLNWTSLCGLHLSRLAEDLILYSSQEFGFVRHSDQYSTGSSLMPQKRNPDGLELVRGASAMLLGDAFSFGCVLKGLPSTYNKDLQADKDILFRSHDKLLDCLKVTTGTVATLEVDSERASSCLEASMLATDVAHALVRRGVPFRRAHHQVGALLRRAAALSCDLRTLAYPEYATICPEIGTEEDLRALFSWEASVEQYSCEGGTARSAVHKQIVTLRDWLEAHAKRS